MGNDSGRENERSINMDIFDRKGFNTEKRRKPEMTMGIRVIMRIGFKKCRVVMMSL